jgi:hypothetical protein
MASRTGSLGRGCENDFGREERTPFAGGRMFGRPSSLRTKRAAPKRAMVSTVAELNQEKFVNFMSQS